MSRFFNGEGRNADFEYGGGVHYSPLERVMGMAGLKGNLHEMAKEMEEKMDSLSKAGAADTAKLKMIDQVVSRVMVDRPREDVVKLVNNCLDVMEQQRSPAPAAQQPPAAKTTVTIKRYEKNIP